MTQTRSDICPRTLPLSKEDFIEMFGNTSCLQNWEISLGYSLVLAVNFRPTVDILTNSQLSLITWLREHSASLSLLLCPGYVYPHGWRWLKIQVTRQKYDIPWYTTKMCPITILNHLPQKLQWPTEPTQCIMGRSGGNRNSDFLGMV